MNEILIIQIITTILIILLGTFLHFTYKLSGNNKIVSFFSSVNESTWEHLKLAFFPIIIFGILLYPFINNITNNYLEAQTISAILSMILITTIFYTYTGVLGKNKAIIDILSYVISIIISQFVSYNIMMSQNFSTPVTQLLSISLILFFTFLFIIFTDNPPSLGIFKDPLEKK